MLVCCCRNLALLESFVVIRLMVFREIACQNLLVVVLLLVSVLVSVSLSLSLSLSLCVSDSVIGIDFGFKTRVAGVLVVGDRWGLLLWQTVFLVGINGWCIIEKICVLGILLVGD